MELYAVIKPIKQAQLYVGNIFRETRDAKFYNILKNIEQKKMTDPEDIHDAALQFSGAKRRLLEDIADKVMDVQADLRDQAEIQGWTVDVLPTCSNMAHYYAHAARLVLQDGFGYHVAIKAVKRP